MSQYESFTFTSYISAVVFADIFMEKIQKCGKKPTDDKKATFYSNGNDQYTKALFKCFDTNTINYGQLIKERENGRVIGKTKKIIFGSLYPEDIDTFIKSDIISL